MKRNLLSLVLLLFGVCAWAQVSVPFAGKTVTFTNIQQNGTETVLFIDENETLQFSTLSIEELGESAKFKCTLEESGKYSLYNEKYSLYMIWRGNNGGYNSNSGTLGEYNSTYCDWDFYSADATKTGTYYFVSKRSDGTTDGSIVRMANGNFDKFGNSIGWAANYSNLYYVNIVDADELTYVYTDCIGNEYKGSYTGIAGTTEPIINGAAGFELTNKEWNGTEFTADIDFGMPISKEGGVTNTVMISSFKVGAGNYVQAYKWYTDGTNVKITRGSSPTVANIDAYSWAIYPSFENGEFTFAIKNISTGKFVYTEAEYANNQGSADATPGVVVLSETATNFSLNCANSQFTYLKNGVTHYLSFGSVNTTDGYLGVYAKNHNGTTNSFPELYYNLSVSAVGVATLYTNYEVEIPEGVEVKYPVAADNGTLTYETLSGTIPAKSAVLLVASEGEYKFTVSNDDVAPLQDNLLFGYSSTTPSEADKVGEDGTVYALGNIDGVVAFYHFVGDKYAAGKAYLEVPSSQNIRSYSIFDQYEGTTSIEETVAEESVADAVIYDLCGRRVETMHRGVYIVNGKKVIIKD